MPQDGGLREARGEIFKRRKGSIRADVQKRVRPLAPEVGAALWERVRRTSVSEAGGHIAGSAFEVAERREWRRGACVASVPKAQRHLWQRESKISHRRNCRLTTERRLTFSPASRRFSPLGCARQQHAGVTGEGPPRWWATIGSVPAWPWPPQRCQPGGLGPTPTASSGAPEAARNSAHMHGPTPFPRFPRGGIGNSTDRSLCLKGKAYPSWLRRRFVSSKLSSRNHVSPFSRPTPSTKRSCSTPMA